MKIDLRKMGLLAASVFVFGAVFAPQPGFAQEQSQQTPSAQSAQAEPSYAEPQKKVEAQQESGHPPIGVGVELAKEEREATGAEEEEHSDLKHSSMVKLMAKATGLTVHQAHLVALVFNFAIIAFVAAWAGRKFLPGIFRNRTASIQQALEEARAASQDANRRLADIETHLRQLDVEIGQMQATAEKEAQAEEGRIQKAAEEDVRKVVAAAEQEIATAAKQARRELSAHTASLAIALAKQQINVDSNTDQVLVRTFASKLASGNNSGKDGQ